MVELGVKISMLMAMDFGVDFYGDIMFATESERNAHLDGVQAFLRARLKGWKYALANPHEIAQLIIHMPSTRKPALSFGQLMYEAREIKHFILLDVVEFGLFEPGYSLNGFL